MTKKRTVKAIINSLINKPSYLRWSTDRLVNKFYPNIVDRYIDHHCWDKVNRAKIKAREYANRLQGYYSKIRNEYVCLLDDTVKKNEKIN